MILNWNSQSFFVFIFICLLTENLGTRYVLKNFTDFYIHTFIAALYMIARRWKQPTCLVMDAWINKIWYIHTMESYPALPGRKFWHMLQNKWTFFHYAKWKNPGMKRQILIWVLYSSQIHRNRKGLGQRRRWGAV